ncbi:MAG TPA: NAD-dependent dehydratase [Marinilabiliales bacterium]|nr:NAD-dependent dehydratase [Marinilabiliales bacterium]
MKVLFIGGTGNISTAVSELALTLGIELFHLNRGITVEKSLSAVKTLKADISNELEIQKVLKNHVWDTVVDWIAFKPQDIERDFRLFHGKTRQFIFISSASAYQKPLLHPVVTESTPLRNPYWNYSRDKIACEDLLNHYYRESGFPITIVRPSHTYRNYVPSCFGFDHGYTLIDSMLKNQPIIVPGTGLSRWTLTQASDFAKGFIGLLGHSESIGHAFHITTDERLTWNQIYQEIGAALNRELRLVHIPEDVLYLLTLERTGSKEVAEALRGNLLGDKLTNVYFDNTKIKTFVPGFKAEITFREGIRRALKWFGDDPVRKIVSQAHQSEMDWMIARWQQMMKA